VTTPPGANKVGTRASALIVGMVTGLVGLVCVVGLLIAGVLLVRARIERETGQATPAGKPTLITSDDWDASTWDPDVLRDIDRRRRADG
jgi:hypothetical protein